MEENFKRGIIYTAHGDIWVERTKHSVESLRKFMPNIPITVFSDKDLGNLDVTTHPLPSHLTPKGSKMYALLNSPYTETLYLDADTHVCEKFDELFELLKVFDMAVAPCIQEKPTQSFVGIPDSFRDANSGVILFRRAENIIKFFELFQDTYQELKDKHNNLDEPSFRYALWNSSLKVATLPLEYNFRVDKPISTRGRVKILHGKKLSYELAKEVNAKEGFRTYVPGEGVEVITEAF